MWGKKREAQSETSPDSDVQKFFSSGPAAPAEQAPPVIAADGVQPPLEVQLSPATNAQTNGAMAQPASENATSAAGEAPRVLRANPVSTAFGDMVALLAKSPAHKHFSLADLEWLLLPPVALNQFALADAKLQNGQTVLTGFVLWARVAPDVDARLTQNQRYPVRLQPNEWRSGDIFWIVDGVGERNAVQHCIKTLTETVFQGKPFKMLTIEKMDGPTAVQK
jgi:cytolysin-activating lysine-acyltransferase